MDNDDPCTARRSGIILLESFERDIMISRALKSQIPHRPVLIFIQELMHGFQHTVIHHIRWTPHSIIIEDKKSTEFDLARGSYNVLLDRLISMIRIDIDPVVLSRKGTQGAARVALKDRDIALAQYEAPILVGNT